MDPSGIWALDLDPVGNVAYTYGKSSTSDSWGVFTYAPESAPAYKAFGTGAAPGPVAIDSTGRFVFVGNQGSNSITVFEHWNTGMQLFERSSAYTAPYADGSPYALPATPLQIAVAPDGSFLYVLCGDQTLKVFSIDYTAGAHLTPVGSAILSGTPTGLAVMPKNNLLFVAESNGVQGYSVDAATGALTLLPVGASAVLANVNGVYAEPSGQFLYVTTSTAGGGAVYGYSVDASGQLTALGAGPLVNSNQPSSMAFTALIQ
jgi:DNA-binding beta-propeller fold protein YncE